MRFANRRGKSHYKLKYLGAHGKSTNDLKYKVPRVLEIDKQEINRDRLDLQSMIPHCYLEKFDENDYQSVIGIGNENKVICDLFEPVFTDSGLCYAYNPIPSLGIKWQNVVNELHHFVHFLLPLSRVDWIFLLF